ncbi:MAG: hypothetical protein SRB2_00589 [Desulfobacteraceae bacterium Eth-SRB2]|nr:MAG: hypothetical protein SRB2_00589 [Desulfobacteraceae bacterium Eth-SRB2]
MNAQLAKVGVFNKLTQKRITAIADVRNSAAHGKWDQFKPEDVEDMIRWITGFIETHLANQGLHGIAAKGAASREARRCAHKI